MKSDRHWYHSVSLVSQCGEYNLPVVVLLLSFILYIYDLFSGGKGCYNC